MSILNNYICTKGLRGFGWLSSSTPSRPDHINICQGPQAARIQLCWILRSLFYGTSLRGCPGAHLLWVMAFLHQNISWSKEALNTQMCRDPGGSNCRLGAGMLHVSSKWKCCFRFTAMTWHRGLERLFMGLLRWESTFKKESNRFEQLCPHKVAHYMKEWTLMEIATWTRWGCYRPGSCSSCLSDVFWLTWRCFPEQLREKETKHASAQVRGGHAP